MNSLTKKQEEVLAEMVGFFRDNQRFPTQLELARKFKVGQNAIVGHLKSMIKKGVISGVKGQARSYKLEGYRAELVPMETVK